MGEGDFLGTKEEVGLNFEVADHIFLTLPPTSINKWSLPYIMINRWYRHVSSCCFLFVISNIV